MISGAVVGEALRGACGREARSSRGGCSGRSASWFCFLAAALAAGGGCSSSSGGTPAAGGTNAAGGAGGAGAIAGAGGGSAGAGGRAPSALTGVAAISAGYFVTCAALADGTARCWGDNGSGRLAVGVSDLRVSLARPVAGLSNVAAVSAGDRHQCALLAAGSVACWGQALSGQLGDGTIPTTTVAGPVQVAGLQDAVSLSVGSDFSCAMRVNGIVDCWGKNDEQQLGAGPVLGATALAPIQGVTGAQGVGAGWVHACAVVGGTPLTGGMVQCWGHNVGGVFGDGAQTGDPGPVDANGLPAPVTGLASATAVSAGRGHSCALRADGSVVCWGVNIDGQLGNGGTTTALTPVAVAGLPDLVASLSVGNDHTCALLKAGTVACWGKNDSGQVGDGTNVDAPGALVVPGLTNVVAVAAGTSHTCAVLLGGTAVCWGDNQYGELGDGTTTSSLVPVLVKTP